MTVLTSPAAREIVFIDSRIPDWHTIVAALRPGVKAVVLNDHEDGVAQMARALQGEQGLASISVVSHGDAGVLLLGKGPLFAGNLAQHQADLHTLGAALAPEGDLLLYGCNVGAGDKGAAFVAALAQATGADVAASNNSTGGADWGGDWTLEVASGRIEAAPSFNTSALAGYDFVLHTATASTLAELQAAIATAQADGTHDFIALTGDIVFVNALDTVKIDVTDGHTLRIVGGGYTLSGNNLARVLEVNTTGVGSAVEISGLTIANGLVAGAGGYVGHGLYSDAPRGSAGAGGDALGAGIWNQGTLTLVGSAVIGNRAAGGGGGGINAGDDAGATPGRAGNTSTDPNQNSIFGAHSGGLASNGVSEIGGGGGGSSGWMGVPFHSFEVSTGRGGHAAGGIYNSGTLTLVGTDFSGNLGAGGGGGSGYTDSPQYYSGNGGTGVGALWNAGGTVRLDTSTQATLTTENNGAGGKVELSSWYPPLPVVGHSIDGIHSPSGTVQTNYTAPPTIISAVYDGIAGILVVTATGLQATAGADNDMGVSALTLSGQGGVHYTLTSANVEIDSATQFTVQLNAADRSQLASLLNKTGLQASDASSYNLSAASGWSTAHPGNADLSGNSVIVQTVNAAPTLSTSTGTVIFTEGNNVLSTPVVVDSALTLADPDSPMLASATVAITGTFQSGKDVLALTSDPASMGAITGSYDAGTGVLTLTSATPATAAQYQAALRSVTYTNSSDLPVEGVRSISFSANDGSLSSAVSTKSVTVVLVNDAPVNHLPGAQTVVQGEALVFSSANGNAITVTDADPGPLDFEVQLTAFDGTIRLASTSGLTTVFGNEASSDFIGFAGNLSAINAALDSLVFTPNAGFYGAASLEIKVDDQGGPFDFGGPTYDQDTLAITVTLPAAQVTGVQATVADGTYKVGDFATIAVSFDQAVTLDVTDGLPTLLLETGSTDRSAQYLSGSGDTMLFFTYTVQAGDSAGGLDYTSSAALTLNGATLHNATGVASNLTLPAPGSARSLAGQSPLVIDGVLPTASIALGDTALGVGKTSLVTITFSEAVAGFTLDDLSATNGVLSNLTSGDGGTTWTATLTPAAGTKAAANGITLDNSGITDLAGNAGSGTTESGNYTVDTVVLVNAAPQFTLPNGGKLLLPVGSSYDEAYSMALQADGKIVLAGNSDNGRNNDFSVVRLNANGSLDTGFGTGGKLLVPVGSRDDEAYSVALQADGKILLAGYSVNVNGSTDNFSVVRLNADGSLDTGFGSGGKLLVPVGSGNDQAYSVTLQADGKIVLAGTSFNGSNYDFSVVRLNADGSLDTGFGSGGKLLVPVGSRDDGAYSVALQADGKILLAGYSVNVNGSTDNFSVVRLNADGSLDTGFGSGGKLLVPVGSRDDEAYSVALQADGKILLAGYSVNVNVNGSDYDFSVVRLNADGSLDTGFGSGGKLLVPVGSRDDEAYSVALQADGKILLAGYSVNVNVNGSDYDFSVVRLNADGSLDTGFGSGGKLLVPVGSGNDQAYSVTLQADGKIVLAGNSDNGRDNDFSVVRLNANGSLDTTFASGGKLLLPVGSSDDYARSVTLQADGKIVLAGNSDNGSNNDFSVVRLNANGSLDTSFASTPGLAHTASYTEHASAVLLNPGAQVFDANLAAQGHYGGASLTLGRSGGASADDLFGASGSLTLSGSDVQWSGTTIGSFTQAGGALAITFHSAATQAIVNGALQSLTYQNTSHNPPASVQVDWLFGDGNTGGQGPGGALTTLGTTTVNITAVNDAPVNTVPTAQSVNQNASLTFNAANGNLLSVSDVDAGAGVLQVTLTASQGTLTLSGTAGLGFTTGDGTADAAMAFSGTQADINAALDGLAYVPMPGYAGAALVQIVTSDGGLSGAGGSLSDTDTVGITVTAPLPPPPTPVDPVPPTPVDPTPPPVPVGDQDGISDAQEDAVPGLTPPGGGAAVAGDGNGDGIKDSLQAGVTSLAFVLSPTAHTSPGSAPPTFITLVAGSQDDKVSSSNARITSLEQKDTPSNLPEGMDMPMGLISFTVALASGTSTEQFSLYVDASLGLNGYWKQNSGGTWVNLASEAYGGKVVLEGGRMRLDFEIEDGGAFDADGKVDGTITDPGAPAYLPLSIVGYAPHVSDGWWF